MGIRSSMLVRSALVGCVVATSCGSPLVRHPPRVAVTPMLDEARLVPSSCDGAAREEIDARVKEMRDALARALRQWHDAQPACTRRRTGTLGGDEIADAFGAGGLGLSGVGEGGGGLGSIGTIGHGAGTGTGAGYGRAGGAARARSASGTNDQVAGVDEADIVKTDGRYVYLASNGALRIVEALDPRIVSVTKLPGGAARELFVEGDRAVVYTSTGSARPRCTYGYDCAFAGDGSSTKVVVLDVADRSAPKIVRQIDLSGSLVAARRIGDAVHTVVADGDAQPARYETWPADLPMCGTNEETAREKFAKLEADDERRIRAHAATFPTMRENGRETRLCDDLYRTPIRDGQAFTSIVSFDLADDAAPPSTATLQSRPGAVFASRDALYVAVVHRKPTDGQRWYSSYSSVDEASEIHRFRIGARPRDTRYVGSGVVPGHVLDQFAMDEWHGYLRIATTRGRVPDPRVSSSVSILATAEGGDLVRVGAVDGIAPGEDVRAVRFDDDRGYVVTFKKTDPLFVLDLHDPTKPAVLGELKIPGFSTYLHRLDPDHLLSIGFDADDHGGFVYFDGVILQLFDVKRPTAPRLVHKVKIGTRGSSSAAATDHLAFNYLAEKGLLALPMTICNGGGDGRHGDVLAFSGLLVYEVNVEKGFTRLGGVDHGTKGVSCGSWWSHATSAVKRSVFLDDLVYSIADDRVKVQRLDALGADVADLPLAN